MYKTKSGTVGGGGRGVGTSNAPGSPVETCGERKDGLDLGCKRHCGESVIF